MADLESKKTIIKNLMEKGKKKGLLTHKEIASAFEEIEITPEELETVYDVLEKENIEVVEDLVKSLKKSR